MWSGAWAARAADAPGVVAAPEPDPNIEVYRELVAAYEESHAKYREVSVEGQGNIRERIDCPCDGCTKVRELLNA